MEDFTPDRGTSRFYCVFVCTRGATMVEYAILLLFVAAVTLGSVLMLGARVSTAFNSANCAAFGTTACAGSPGTGSGAGGHGHHGHHGGGNHGNNGNHGHQGKQRQAA